MIKRNNQKKPMLWKRGLRTPSPKTFHSTVVVDDQSAVGKVSANPLVNVAQNLQLNNYENQTKNSFDNIEPVIKRILSHVHRNDFVQWANKELYTQLGIRLDSDLLNINPNTNAQFLLQTLYAKAVFAQFLKMSEHFFIQDPLEGRQKQAAEERFKAAGIHAVGISPCADGRLAHLVSYVLRLPYTSVRRKAHAGGLFDISESVRNWVFVEHTRYRDGIPNSAEEATHYLKVAAYHYSDSDPHHQGCAAHGSDDTKAAEAALSRLEEFKQAIVNRFGYQSRVETLLIGVNTDNDALKIHVPDNNGNMAIDRFVDTNTLFDETHSLDFAQAEQVLLQSIDDCNAKRNVTLPSERIRDLLAWFIGNNFSQIAYVRQFEAGQYQDIGHAERFISLGSGFEELQLRNLSYYSFLDTVEEGQADIDVGVKIFKSLNVKKGLPIPVIIRCDYDGRVPGSYDRAVSKAKRIEMAVHTRYEDLSKCGLLKTMATLRDKTSDKPAECL